ncbi:MAG: protease inhibitor I42 family protein [Myxococcales bacterium]|nr:protease inhibitor I42 family protein [Myxococcales bacterium]
MRLSLLVLFAPLAASLAACSGSGSPEGAPSSSDELRRSEFVDVTERDDDTTLSVEKGKSVRVTLPANATTGYAWRVTSTNRTFGYPSPRDGTYEGAHDGPVGSGGHQVFVWKTNGAHLEAAATVHRVTLEYRRSFENDETPAQRTFSFGVKIKAAGATDEPEARRCPTSSSINCMPPTTNPHCASDFRAWAQANCGVSYLD